MVGAEWLEGCTKEKKGSESAGPQLLTMSQQSAQVAKRANIIPACVSSSAQAAWEVVRSSSLGVFQNHRDVALRDVVGGHGEMGCCLDVSILEVFSNLNDSVV